MDNSEDVKTDGRTPIKDIPTHYVGVRLTAPEWNGRGDTRSDYLTYEGVLNEAFQGDFFIMEQVDPFTRDTTRMVAIPSHRIKEITFPGRR